MRIAKYISNAGFCSRREAEQLIWQKKVFINNICCEHPSTKVSIDDQIKIDNKSIKIEKGKSIIEMEYLPFRSAYKILNIIF